MVSTENQCVRSILGISQHKHWKDHISSEWLAEILGIEESMKDILTAMAWTSCSYYGHQENPKTAAVWWTMEEVTMPWTQEEMRETLQQLI